MTPDAPQTAPRATVPTAPVDSKTRNANSGATPSASATPAPTLASAAAGVQRNTDNTDLQNTDDAQTELARRQKSAATTVLGLIVATILLSVVAYLGQPYFNQQDSRPIDWAFLILVLILGLGAVRWRRKIQSDQTPGHCRYRRRVGFDKNLRKTTLPARIFAALASSASSPR